MSESNARTAGRRIDDASAGSDNRALSSTVNYVLALAVTSILVSGLLIAGSGYMESQRTIAIGNALEVQNEQLVDSIGEIDRLATAMDDEDGNASIRAGLPDRVIDRSYRIAVVNETDSDDPRYTYRLEATSGDVERSTVVRTTQPAEETTIRGGSVVIRYERVGGDGTLLLESSERIRE